MLNALLSNSILVEKWKRKGTRLVIQLQKRVDSQTDLWEGEYTYSNLLAARVC